MDRIMKIAIFLLESQKPVIVDEMASMLSVSNKTIRNDLEKLQDIVEREGLVMRKKTGVGIYIEGAEVNKATLLQSLRRESQYIPPYSPEGRQNYILEKLFMAGQVVTTTALADRLYVSSTTIHNDLKQIEEWIKPYNLILVKEKNGKLEITGREEDYRKAMSSLISHIKKVEEVQSSFTYEYHGKIDFLSLQQLKSLIDLDYKTLEELLSHLENQLQFRFSQEAYISLIIHIAIAIKRISSCKDIILSEEILNSIKDTKEFCYAKQMSFSIQEKFHVSIPESEIGYITLHILGSKMHEKDLASFHFPMENAEELELAVEIAKNIIAVASDTLHMNLYEDRALVNGLVLHLRPTINRLKYGLTLRNPILEDIKENYPEIFGVAWLCSRMFEKYLNVKLPESEIGYITLHLAAAVERNRKKIKTLVVCHSGIGSSQLLSVRLQKLFKELEIVGIVSSSALNDEMLENVQLIVSTIPLKAGRPVLVINPLLTQVDIRKVEQCIYGLNTNTEPNRQLIVHKEFFYRSRRFRNRNDVIHEVCECLEKKQYVTSEFRESMLLRESIMSTEMGNRIAIPHGDPKQIRESCIALVVLKKPFTWKKGLVEFIFVVCIAERDLVNSKYFFRNLYRNMDKPEFLEGLRSGASKAEHLLDQLMK